MTEINERIAKVKEQIIDTKIMREQLGLKDYDEIIDDFEVFITTIESQKEEIEKLEKANANVHAWREKGAIENSRLEREIKSLKAITELAVKGLKEMESMKGEYSGVLCKVTAKKYLSEIERLQNG